MDASSSIAKPGEESGTALVEGGGPRQTWDNGEEQAVPLRHPVGSELGGAELGEDRGAHRSRHRPLRQRQADPDAAKRARLVGADESRRRGTLRGECDVARRHRQRPQYFQ